MEDLWQIQADKSKVSVIISGAVTKKDLKNIYRNQMLKKSKPARKYYDAIILSAKICPYCGVGHVTTLDHFLPKSPFPFLAVYPANLVHRSIYAKHIKIL